MNFNKKLEKFFILLIIIPLLYMIYTSYENKSFRENPLSEDILNNVGFAEKKVLDLIYKKYNFKPFITLIISNDFNSRLYGITSYKNAHATIYLNKKRFKESSVYMIEEVIPHEYAHAIVFILGKKTSQDGHTKVWKDICFKLDGKACVRYVDNEAIIREKMINFLN